MVLPCCVCLKCISFLWAWNGWSWEPGVRLILGELAALSVVKTSLTLGLCHLLSLILPFLLSRSVLSNTRANSYLYLLCT